MPTIKRVGKKKPWVKKQEAFRFEGYTRDPFYDSPAWRKFRKLRLSEEPLCRICKEAGRFTEARVLDHINPLREGGARLSRTNTQPICHSCHNKKSGRQRGGGSRLLTDKNI